MPEDLDAIIATAPCLPTAVEQPHVFDAPEPENPPDTGGIL